MQDVQVDFSAVEADDDMLVELTLLLPSGWAFTQSFPDLPGSYDPAQDEEEDRNRPSMLDELSLGTSRLVFTNRAHHSDARRLDGRGGKRTQRDAVDGAENRRADGADGRDGGDPRERGRDGRA